MVLLFSSPTRATAVSWEGVSTSSSLTFHFSLLQIRNSVQWWQTSDGRKETHAAELTLGHLFILQKLASLRNLIIAQQMDKRRTEREGGGRKHRKQKCTAFRRTPLFYFMITPRKECSSHCSFIPSLENQEQGSEEARMLSVTLSYIQKKRESSILCMVLMYVSLYHLHNVV